MVLWFKLLELKKLFVCLFVNFFFFNFNNFNCIDTVLSATALTFRIYLISPSWLIFFLIYFLYFLFFFLISRAKLFKARRETFEIRQFDVFSFRLQLFYNFDFIMAKLFTLLFVAFVVAINSILLQAEDQNNVLEVVAELDPVEEVSNDINWRLILGKKNF